MQQSSLECQVEQRQTPYHTLKNSREGAAFPRTTSTRPPWHTQKPRDRERTSKNGSLKLGPQKSYEAHPSRRRCKQGCTTSASENSKNSVSGAGRMSENRTLVARAEKARLRKDLASQYARRCVGPTESVPEEFGAEKQQLQRELA